jgi:hypothetical protein
VRTIAFSRIENMLKSTSTIKRGYSGQIPTFSLNLNDIKVDPWLQN